MQPKKHLLIFLCASGTCLFFTIIGILFICLWPNIYEAIIRSQMVIKPHSYTYDVWVKTPIPLSLTIFLFNWTNPQEIYNKSSKPRFEQLGPYVYKELREKTNIVWNDNDTVTYQNLKRWWFDPANSKGSLNDQVTSINPLALSASHVLRNWHLFLKRGFSMSLRAFQLNTIDSTHSVGDILFDGYNDPLLSMASKIPFLPKSSAMEKFGWFYGRNGSTDFDGIFNVNTGASGQIGQLQTWKYSNYTGYYPGECGAFSNASAGDFFPRKLTNESVIKFFSSDLCRYMELEFEKEVLVRNIVGYKYVAADKFLDNGTKIPENKCFCDGKCMPSGTLNVSNCRQGSPAFVSLPHFYRADPYYLNAVDGLRPDPDIHEFYMIFEPNTGIPLSVSARLQLNLRIEPVHGISLFENVPTAFFPILYFEQKVDVPEDMTFKIKLLINFQVIFLSIGVIIITVSILVFLCVFWRLWSTKKIFRAKRHTPAGIKIPTIEEVPLNQ